jgi:hypothetical protein
MLTFLSRTPAEALLAMVVARKNSIITRKDNEIWEALKD